MKVNVFKGRGNWYAFAASNDGSVLPPENGPWVPWKILDMNRGEAPRVGISTEEVIDAIQDGNAYLVEMKDGSRERNVSPHIGPGFPRPDPIRRAADVRPCCHHGFISSRSSALSNFPPSGGRIARAPRQCIGVLDGVSECTCQVYNSPILITSSDFCCNSQGCSNFKVRGPLRHRTGWPQRKPQLVWATAHSLIHIMAGPSANCEWS